MKSFNKINKTKSNNQATKLRRTYRWRRYSEKLRQKFYHICQNPDGCEYKATEVHHINPAVSHPHLFFTEWNTIPLCHDCHDSLAQFNDVDRERLIERWRIILSNRS